MFCTNCGAKLPEGSKFCMQCGAKLTVVEEPAPSTDNWNEPLETVVEQETVVEKRPAVSFDWSSVKEESHKKEVPEVHSPWGTTGLGEKELFAEVSTPSDDRSRTMSFIDILKKERDAKAQAAEEVARPVTERVEPEADYSDFQEAPSFYMPQMYDDVESPTVTPFDNMDDDDDEEKVEIDIPRFVEAESVDNDEVDIEAEVKEASEDEEFSFAADVFGSDITDDDAELYHTSSFDGPEFSATEDFSGLEASLAAILDAGAGKPTDDEDIDLFEGVKEDSVEDMYLSPSDDEVEVSYYSAEEALPEEEPVVDNDDFEFVPKHGGADFANEIEVESEEDLDEEAIEELENLYISNEEVEAEVEPEAEPDLEQTLASILDGGIESAEVEEPEVAPAPQESVDDEIEALKKRLAELMGEKETAVAEEPAVEVPTVEEPAPEVQEVEELLNELPEALGEAEYLEDAMVADQFEVELTEEVADEDEGVSIEEAFSAIEDSEDFDVEEEVVVEEPTPVAPVEAEPESDALSLEELEKNLFEEADAEGAEPEATKKIDKFYTLYKKNEEFQKLLDEEYSKLQGEDKVPHVDDFVPVEIVKDEVIKEEFVTPVIQGTEEKVVAPVAVAPENPVEAPVTPVAPNKAEEKAAAKEAKRAAKAAKKNAEESDEESSGGGALTVIAVIIAALLVILLAVILVINFLPDSAIAMKIDTFIETITSMFSATGVDCTKFLL